MRERGGRTVPAVFKSESAALGFIVNRVAKASRIVADEARSWNDLQGRFTVDRIDHTKGIRWAAFTRTALRSSSPASVAPRSAITTTSLGLIWSAMPKRRRFAKITAGWTMLTGSDGWSAGDGVQAVG
jgi:hypothetical protein